MLTTGQTTAVRREGRAPRRTTGSSPRKGGRSRRAPQIPIVRSGFRLFLPVLWGESRFPPCPASAPNARGDAGAGPCPGPGPTGHRPGICSRSIRSLPRAASVLPASPSAQESAMFTTNEGTIDRVIRVIVGLALLAAFFMYPDAGWRWFALLGLVPLLTGLIGTCPIYRLLGISTCPVKRR